MSAATVWELEIKRVKGKLTFSGMLLDIVRGKGFAALPVSMAHGVRAAELPLLHKDPFDRMLVAQALMEDLLLVTFDKTLSGYGVRVLA